MARYDIIGTLNDERQFVCPYENSFSQDALKIYDITQPVSEDMPLYPGDPATIIIRVADIVKGDPFTLSAVSMSAHAGTHVDAPYHVNRNGHTLDEIPLDNLVGSAFVLLVHDSDEVTAEALESAGTPSGTRRLLLKTKPRQSSEAFLNADAARWIVDRGISLLGMDVLSIDAAKSQTLEAHHILLDADVIVVEGLDLSAISEGEYMLICLPLKLSGCDGAPARVVLIEGADLDGSSHTEGKGG